MISHEMYRLVSLQQHLYLMFGSMKQDTIDIIKLIHYTDVQICSPSAVDSLRSLFCIVYHVPMESSRSALIGRAFKGPNIWSFLLADKEEARVLIIPSIQREKTALTCVRQWISLKSDEIFLLCSSGKVKVTNRLHRKLRKTRENILNQVNTIHEVVLRRNQLKHRSTCRKPLPTAWINTSPGHKQRYFWNWLDWQ